MLCLGRAFFIDNNRMRNKAAEVIKKDGVISLSETRRKEVRESLKRSWSNITDSSAVRRGQSRAADATEAKPISVSV